MSLHSGVDTIAFVSNGAYTETYGVGEESSIANLFGSYGFVESAVTGVVAAAVRLFSIRGFISKRFPWMKKLKRPPAPKPIKRLPVRMPKRTTVLVKKIK